MKPIVIYKSKTDFTKRYAEIIAKEIGCEMVELKKADVNMMSQHDTIIFGSRVHAGKIDDFEKAKALFDKSKSKSLYLFVTGATPCAAEEVIDEFWNKNLREEELKNIPHFYCQSGLCYEKMNFLDKTMMKLFATIMKKKKDKDEYEKGFVKAISSSYDNSSKEYIMPLIAKIKANDNLT